MSTAVIDAPNSANERVRAALEAKPGVLLELVAQQEDVSLRGVLDALPAGEMMSIAGDRFDDVWKELMQWGKLLFLVHTRDIVLEIKGSLPEGSYAHGYFNVHGDSPIAGHFRAHHCTEICLVDRLFQTKRSCSVWFFNELGEAMFKIFVIRGEDRELKADQLERFEAMKKGFAS